MSRMYVHLEALFASRVLRLDRVEQDSQIVEPIPCLRRLPEYGETADSPVGGLAAPAARYTVSRGSVRGGGGSRGKEEKEARGGEGSDNIHSHVSRCGCRASRRTPSLAAPDPIRVRRVTVVPSCSCEHLQVREFWCRLDHARFCFLHVGGLPDNFMQEHACSLGLALHIRPCPREALFAHLGPPIQPEGAITCGGRRKGMWPPCASHAHLLEFAFTGYCGKLSRFRPQVTLSPVDLKLTFSKSEQIAICSQVKRHGGQMIFPFLVDETAGVAMNESAAIVRHLWKHYAGNVLPDWPRPSASYNLASLQDFKKIQTLEPGVCVAPGHATHMSFRAWRLLDVPTLVASCLVRPFPSNGVMLAPSKSRAQGESCVRLYGHEGCPETRVVREVLCTLQVPYLLIPTGMRTGSSTDPEVASGWGEGHGREDECNGETPILIDGGQECRGDETEEKACKLSRCACALSARAWDTATGHAGILVRISENVHMRVRMFRDLILITFFLSLDAGAEAGLHYLEKQYSLGKPLSFFAKNH